MALGIDDLLIGAAAMGTLTAADSYAHRHEEKMQREATAHAIENSGLQMASPHAMDELTVVWFNELTDNINRCCHALGQLYDAINYQPMYGACVREGDYSELYFQNMKRIYPAWQTGVFYQENDRLKYFINAVGSYIIIDLKKPISLGVGTQTKRVRDILEIIRFRYWIPNEDRWKKWLKFAMELQGHSQWEYACALREQQIPVDSPANDIVYRTRDEVTWFDSVAERIITLTEFVDIYSLEWNRIARGNEPSEEYLNARHQMSVRQWGLIQNGGEL